MARKMRYILGIDPGLNGGIVLVDEQGKIRRKHTIPRTGGKTGPVDVHALKEIAQNYIKYDVTVFMEELAYNALFVMSKGSVARLYHCYGVIEGVFAAEYSYQEVSYKTWQPIMFKGVKPIYKKKKKGQKKASRDTKAMALATAKRIKPKEKFLKTKRSSTPHDGLVDAYLIAEYGRRQIIGN
jgi:hypothetical protein